MYIPAVTYPGLNASSDRRLMGVIALASAVSVASGAARIYQAALELLVPNVATKPGACALPTASVSSVYGFSARVLPAGPRSSPPASLRPAVRWSYVGLARAAAAHWNSA